MRLRWSTLRNLLSVCVLGISAVIAGPVPAHAKTVSLRWKALEGAIRYELEVKDSSQKVHTLKSVEEPTWSGELTPGWYSYRMRAYDWMKRAGEWSEPKPLVVMPNGAEAVAPKKGASFEVYASHGTVTLQWKPMAGATQYKVKVQDKRGGGKRDDLTLFESAIAGTSVVLPKVAPGNYQWSIAPVIQASAPLAGKHWEGPSEEVGTFSVERKELKVPSPVSPATQIRPPTGRKLEFEWKPVPGAVAYRIKVYREKELGRKPASTPPVIEQTVKGDLSSTVLEIRDPSWPEGRYSWTIAAIAKPDSAEVPAATSREALADFKIDRNALFVQGTGYVALSTMLAPYTYRTISPATNRSLDVASAALTGRFSGEYWLMSRFGVALALEDTGFGINGQTYHRMSGELTGKWRMKFDEDRFGWFFAPKVGLETRDYFYFNVAKVNNKTTFVSSKLSSLGGAIGFDLRRQFNERWSVGAKVSYFVPLTLGGQVSGAKLSKDASYRNLNLGLQALYWFKKEWSFAAGASIDKRSISFLPSGASAAEQAYMDGVYFFGSVIYSFGRQ